MNNQVQTQASNNKTAKTAAGVQISPYQRLVSLPVQADNIFHFPEGLPAFENVKEFVFLLRPDTKPFIFMQSLNPPDLAFVCIDPFMVYSDYCPNISEGDRMFLRLERPEDAMILSIVTVRPNVRETTTNLQGPIVINIQSCIGKQIVCEGQQYPLRYRIWDALEKVQARGGEAKPAYKEAGVV